MIKNMENVAETHPYIVIILMHEVTRLLFPNDPYIHKVKKSMHQLDCLEDSIRACNTILLHFAKIGSYKLDFSSSKNSYKPIYIRTVIALL